MSHRHRPHLGSFAYCHTHRKVSHASRKNARRAARLLAEPGVREYRCDQVDGLWHIGHLPVQVRRGEATMRETRS